MTNHNLFTPFSVLSPFDLALSCMDSFTAVAPAFSRQAAIMAHRESLNSPSFASLPQVIPTRLNP